MEISKQNQNKMLKKRKSLSEKNFNWVSNRSTIRLRKKCEKYFQKFLKKLQIVLKELSKDLSNNLPTLISIGFQRIIKKDGWIPRKSAE